MLYPFELRGLWLSTTLGNTGVQKGQSSTKSSTTCLEISRNLGMFLGIFLGIPVEPITPPREASETQTTGPLIGFRIGAART